MLMVELDNNEWRNLQKKYVQKKILTQICVTKKKSSVSHNNEAKPLFFIQGRRVEWMTSKWSIYTKN